VREIHHCIVCVIRTCFGVSSWVIELSKCVWTDCG